MKNELERIIDLQTEYSSKHTPAMKERGQLVSGVGPAWLKSFEDSLATAIGIPKEDLLAEGKDHAGNKSEIPWFRFASKRRSPNATIDWYCAYLFDIRSEGVYLSLMTGSSIWNSGHPTTRQRKELEKLAAWGREKIAHLTGDKIDLVNALSLHARGKLGRAYEPSTAIAKHYRRSDIPQDEVMEDDAIFFGKLLQEIYKSSTQEHPPGQQPDEVSDAVEAAEKAAGKKHSRGKRGGFRANSKQKKAIELHAMSEARSYLVSLGYSNIKDTSGSKPYDYTCTGPDGLIYVEVKGTQSDGSKVVLTRNEVELQRKEFPVNALIIVSGIRLSGKNHDVASGGESHIEMPWQIKETNLQVISYQFETDIKNWGTSSSTAKF